MKYQNYINEFVFDTGSWADKTFTESTKSSIIAHLKKEIVELADNVDDVEEAADCILLIFHLAYKQNWNLEKAMEDKLNKNKNRIWGKPDHDGVVEHVRE